MSDRDAQINITVELLEGEPITPHEELNILKMYLGGQIGEKIKIVSSPAHSKPGFYEIMDFKDGEGIIEIHRIVLTKDKQLDILKSMAKIKIYDYR